MAPSAAALTLLAGLVDLSSALQLPFLAPAAPRLSPAPTSPASSHTFQLRHALHLGTYRNPGLFLRRDITPLDRAEIDVRAAAFRLMGPAVPEDVLPELEVYESTQRLRSTRGKVWKPRGSREAWDRARRRSILSSRAARGSRNATVALAKLDAGLDADFAGVEELGWDGEEVEVPDVKDLGTLQSLAKMTNDAYVKPDDGSWYDPGGKWNVSDSFGWEDDGVRGHVFATPDNSTIVIAIKGTSAPFLWSGGKTGANDKLNDNLLFSCCCARVDWTWTPVCDCFRGGYKCDLSCVEDSLISQSVYFPIATDLYNNVTALYPHSNIWLAGHSLGGALASLVGMTFGAPTVTFEAVPELLAARRLHLPLPPGAEWGQGREGSGVTHVYHTADPIAMGTCTGLLSTCGAAGYAMESKCHTGRSIVYDTVGKLHWSVDLRTHTIRNVIEHVLIENWDKSGRPQPDDPNGLPPCNDTDSAPSSFLSSSTSRLWKFRWPWTGRGNDTSSPGDGDGDEDSEKKKKRKCDPDAPKEPKDKSHVPPVSEEACEEGDCFKWEFVDEFDDEAHVRKCKGRWL